MSDSTHLSTWVTRQTKEAFGIVARRQGLSESALLKRLIEVSLMTAGAIKQPVPEPIEPIPLNGRLSIRLPADDLAALRARATARDMRTSTYTALLIRAHLRALTPLPTAELAALKRSVAELGAIGRNINQIARAVNQGERPNRPTRADLQAMLRALTGLRDHTKSLINANLASWESGHEKAPDQSA